MRPFPPCRPHAIPAVIAMILTLAFAIWLIPAGSAMAQQGQEPSAHGPAAPPPVAETQYPANAGPGASPPSNTLRVGYFVLAPHALEKGDQPEARGAAIDYTKMVAGKMAIPVTFMELPFSRLMKYMDDGRIDAALFLVRTPEREAAYRYPDHPFTRTRSAVAVRADSPLSAVSAASDLMGMTIGYFELGYASPFILDAGIPLERITGSENIFQMLLKLLVNHRIDAVYSPAIGALEYDAGILAIRDQIRILPLPEPEIDLYTVFGPGVPDGIVSEYNRVHNETRERYDTYLQPYLNPKAPPPPTAP